MKRYLPKVMLLLFFSFHLISCLAQDEIELDPVTVTASLTLEKISKTGRNVFVIKGEEFYHFPINSIDELLRYLPGIEVQARGPMGSQSDIVLRGGTFQQVLVILDGIRLNDPNTGHFTSYIPIAPAEIDRIEILKGASSALYGSEAVGGVIHIITKTFSAKKNIKNKNSTAQFTGGQYGLFAMNAGAFFSNGKTSVGAGVLSNNATGQQQRGINGFFHNNTASISLNHFFNDGWQLALRTSFDDRKFAAQNFYTSFTSDTANEKVKTLWNQLQLVHNTKKNILRFNLGYKKLNDNFLYNSISTQNENKSGLLQASITDEWKVKNNTIIATGAQYIHKKITSNDRGNHLLNQAAIFAVLNQQLGRNFFISPAARMEWNEKVGLDFVPQINFSYHINKIQLRASVGKTIRDADFTERYNNYNKSYVSSGRIGNPDLEAEHSFSYEAGGDYFATSNIKISSSFFQRHHSKLIDYITTAYNDMPRKENLSPTGTYALAKNISIVKTSGFETDIQFTKNFKGAQQIYTTIGLVWLQSESSDAAPSFYISSHAKFMVNFNAQYRCKRFGFYLNGLYKNREPQSTPSPAIAKVSKDYFLLNAKAESYWWQQKLSVFIQADNLLNKNYTDLLGSQMPGRWLMGGVRLQFEGH